MRSGGDSGTRRRAPSRRFAPAKPAFGSAAAAWIAFRKLALLLPFGALAALAGCSQAEPPLTGAAERSPALQQLLAKANEAHRRGSLRETEEMLRRAHAEAPDDLDIALDLGDTLTRLGRNESARAHYAAFLSRHPSASAARLAHGRCLVSLARAEEAIPELDRAARELGTDAGAWLALGEALGDAGRTEEALAPLRRAAELAPADPAAHAALGAACLRIERLDEAIAALERSLELDPGSAPALFGLAQAYARAGRAEESRSAQDRFRKASHGREEELDRRRLLRAARAQAARLAARGDHEKALRALLAYQDQLEDYAPYQVQVGVALLDLGQAAESEAALRRAIQLDRTLSDAYLRLAELYEKTGKPEEAAQARRAAEAAAVGRPYGAPKQ
jgi:tetratricopeptide (TPR) repeat protein